MKPIKGLITDNTESKTITNIEIILDKLKGLENAIKYKLQERDYVNFAETYMYKNNLLNKLRMVYNLTNNIRLRNLMVDPIKQNLTELVNNLDGKMITFTYFQKKLNNLVLTHYTKQGDISFMFDIIPNLDMYQREKEQIDIKGKIKKLFKETTNLKQKRKYLNALIYIEYLKQLNERYEDIKIFVNNSSFNKGAYEQIKKIENIPLSIFDNRQVIDNKLDEVINEKAHQII